VKGIKRVQRQGVTFKGDLSVVGGPVDRRRITLILQEAEKEDGGGLHAENNPIKKVAVLEEGGEKEGEVKWNRHRQLACGEQVSLAVRTKRSLHRQ